MRLGGEDRVGRWACRVVEDDGRGVGDVQGRRGASTVYEEAADVSEGVDND